MTIPSDMEAIKAISDRMEREAERDAENAAELIRSIFTPFDFGDVTVCHERPGGGSRASARTLRGGDKGAA